MKRVSVIYLERILKNLPKGYMWELEVRSKEVIVHIRDDLNMWSNILYNKEQIDNLRETVKHLSDVDKMSKDELD
jgi:hypothetical protein